jgi:hypothetical protein
MNRRDRRDPERRGGGTMEDVPTIAVRVDDLGVEVLEGAADQPALASVSAIRRPDLDHRDAV